MGSKLTCSTFLVFACKRRDRRRAQQLPKYHPHAAGGDKRVAHGSGEGGARGGREGQEGGWFRFLLPAIGSFGVVGSRNGRRRSIRPRERSRVGGVGAPEMETDVDGRSFTILPLPFLFSFMLGLCFSSLPLWQGSGRR
jgi:hypothetical protein